MTETTNPLLEVPIEERMTQQIKAHLSQKSKVHPCRVNRASEVGHPCPRYLAYTRVAWQHKSPPDATLQVIFDDGNLHEQYMIRLMQDSGIVIEETQKGYEWREYEITGHLDGKIRTKDEDGKTYLAPLEIKSNSPFTFDRIRSQADLYDPKRFWLEKWAAQIQLYLLMDSKPWGILALKNKAAMGAFPIRLIRIDLDYDLAEDLLQRAERNNQVVRDYFAAEDRKAGQEELDAILPERIEPSEETCGRCSFMSLCMGARSWGPELVVMTDDQIITAIERRAELIDPSKEYKRVHDHLRQAIINAGGNVLAGGYHLTIDGRKSLKVVQVG